MGAGAASGVRLTVIATALMAVGTFSQFVFSALGPYLVADFELSRAQLGALTTVLFAVAALLSSAMGHATDRFRPALMYAAAFGLAAVSVAGIAMSPVYPVLVLFAGVGGMTQAVVNPLSNKLVADHVPPRRRGLVMGIKQSGVQMSAVLAGVSLPLVAALVGWRPAVGAVAVLILGGWLASVGQLPEHTPDTDAQRTDQPGRVDREVVVLGTYAFLMGSVMAAVNAYLPLYAHEVVGLTPSVAGTLVAVVGLVGIGSRILAGHLTDRRGEVAALLNLLVVVSAAGMVLLVLAERAGPWLVWAAAAVFGLSVSWNAVVMIAVVKLGGASSTGRASGHVMTRFFVGFIVAPVVFGLAVDAVGYTAPWRVLAGLLIALSIAIWYWRRRAVRTARGARPPR